MGDVGEAAPMARPWLTMAVGCNAKHICVAPSKTVVSSQLPERTATVLVRCMRAGVYLAIAAALSLELDGITANMPAAGFSKLCQRAWGS